MKINPSASAQPPQTPPLGAAPASQAPAPVVASGPSEELATCEQETAGTLSLQAKYDRLVQQGLGVKSPKLASTLLTQAKAACRQWAQPGDEGLDALGLDALQMVSSLQPKGSVQAMLAVQMLGVHSVATRSLACAAADGVCVEDAERHSNRGIRLMRLYAQQAELMARLQGTITTQKMVIERIEMASGSQAVVGVLESPKGRGEGGQRYEN